MITMLCLALLGQIRTIEDGAMTYAVENSLIDWRKKPAFLSDLVAEPISTRILLLGSDEYRFRRLAYADLKGEQFVPALFVGLRLRDPNTRMLCRRLLLETLICPTCCGEHRCFRFVEDPKDQDDCQRCGNRRWEHNRSMCDICHGSGFMIDIEDWPEPRPFVAQE